MYYVGIDLGGTNIAAGIVDGSYNIIKKGSVPTLASRPAEEIVASMAGLVSSLVKDCSLLFDDIEYVGIAAPGTINPEEGSVEYANNLPFRDFKLVDALKKLLPCKKFYIENDANAAALGEAVAGAAKGVKDSVMITLGTGLGGGIIIDGKLCTGFNHAGGELGHIVIEYNGVPCTCGRRGCWEVYSSATALSRMTREKMQECPDSSMWDLVKGDISRVGGKTAFTAMKNGDIAAKEVVDKYISYLACGIASMINIFQPEVFCIGGGICNEGDYLIKPLLKLVDQEQYTRANKKRTVIRTAALGNDAGIIGAAALGNQ